MTQLPDEIAIDWHFTNVQEIDESLTNDEAKQVLQLIKQNHDRTTGISWETIEAWVDYLKLHRRSDDMKPLADGDYEADDSCAVWIDVRGFTVNLHTTDEGIIVDVFNAEQLRAEPFAEPVASTYAFDHEHGDTFYI